MGFGLGSNGIVTISGANSQWNNSTNLTIGASGTGSLTVSSGGALTNQYSAIGDAATSVSTATVTGTFSSWVNSAYIYIGKSGTGTLTVSNGATASASIVFLGYYAGANGTLNVTGAGSQFTSGSSLMVVNGTGTTTVSSGGLLSTQTAQIQNSGSSVTVTGTGSEWNAADIYIEPDTSLVISNGGVVDSSSGAVSTSSANAVTVTGAGSRWNIAGDLSLGDDADGNLTISNGAVVTSADGILGSGLNGTALVTGTNSSWNLTGDLTVGSYGNGSLNIQNGATVTSATGSIGYFTDTSTTGVVTVSGSGSSWTMPGDLTVGVGADGGGGMLIPASGTLNISSSGAVSAANVYIGAGAVSLGAVTVSGLGSSLTSSGGLTIGQAGQGSLTIANGGTVTVNGGSGTVRIADQAGSNGTLNIGAASVSAAAPSGLLNAAAISFGSGSGTLVFNHTDTNDVVASVISGVGSIEVLSGFTRLTGNSSTFSGTTTVAGGSLSVNGWLGGQLVINNSGMLLGSGTVGTTTINSGGMIAPGNSIGTLTVNGNLTVAAGAIYTVELNAAGRSDRINVTGMAQLQGGSVLVPAGNVFSTGYTYTILAATAGVVGKFASLSVDSIYNTLFLTPGLSYDSYNVYLKLTRNSRSFASLGATPNEIAAGGGLESVGSGHLYNAVLQLNDVSTARRAYDQISGEIHASAKTALIDGGHFVRDSANDHLRAAFGIVPASSLDAMAYAGGAVEAATPFPVDDQSRKWARAYGAWGKTASDGNAASLRTSTGGLVAGVDGSLADPYRAGIMGGYSNTFFSTGDRGSGSSANYQIGLYGGAQWASLMLRSSVSYTLHDIQINRTATFPGYSDNLKASYFGGSFQAANELGYQISASGGVVEPFVNLAYINLVTSGFTEQGGTAALSAGLQAANVVFSTLGVRRWSSAMIGSLAAQLNVMVGWQHAYGDTIPVSANRFAGGETFGVSGAPIAPDAAVVEAGLDFTVISSAKLGFYYDGSFGVNATRNSVSARFVAQF